MDIKVFSINQQRVYPYLLSWIPDEYLSTEYISDNGAIEGENVMSAFNSLMLNGKSPENLYSQLRQLLISTKDIENPRFLMRPEQYDEFIFLLFATETLINHLHRFYTRENKIIQFIKEWLAMKIQIRESNDRNLAIFLKHPKWKDESGKSCNDIVGFSHSIDIILELRYKSLGMDYSHIKLEGILGQKATINYLKQIHKKFQVHNDNRDIIVGLTTHLLGKYLNDNAHPNLPKTKQTFTISAYHTRYLIPFYELLGWRKFEPEIHSPPTSIKYYEKAIKAFRTHLDSLTKD